jgi:hypothetical protein
MDAVAAVTLIPFTQEAHAAFVEEEVENCAEQQVRDAGWPLHEALERARAELTPVLDHELDEAAANGEHLWSAVDADGRPSGGCG